MKVLISADMEGTAGVIHDSQVTPPDQAGVSSPDYQWARQLMVEEVNACIEGAFAGGATAVVVNEAHDGMRNLLPDRLDPRSRLINGSNKPLSMIQGIELGIEAVICIGWHAAANTIGGVLAHTYASAIRGVSLNGTQVGELGFFAAWAGQFGVPVVMVSGDDKLAVETKQLLGEQVVCVIVKQGISETAALHCHPLEARKMIEAGATQAVQLAKQIPPLTLSTPILMEIELPAVTQADFAEQMPGAYRVSPTKVAYQAPDMTQTFKAFMALLRLAGRNK